MGYTVYHVSGCCDPAFIYDHEFVTGERIRIERVLWPTDIKAHEPILCGTCGDQVPPRDLGFEAQDMARAAMRQT